MGTRKFSEFYPFTSFSTHTYISHVLFSVFLMPSSKQFWSTISNFACIFYFLPFLYYKPSNFCKSVLSSFFISCRSPPLFMIFGNCFDFCNIAVISFSAILFFIPEFYLDTCTWKKKGFCLNIISGCFSLCVVYRIHGHLCNGYTQNYLEFFFVKVKRILL